MTNNTLVNDLDAFGSAYATMRDLGIDDEIIFSFVTDFSKRFEDDKPEPKVFYRIYMRKDGKPWGVHSNIPKFITFADAKKYLLDFYRPFEYDHDLSISDDILNLNFWANRYDIRKVTERN
ncbi:hypothetical protein PBI_MIMI_47 [Arthrobacter phage Mimi]|nr:hypothetical protein PBI_MIMI_127 [Arthrobacter phage Mimi]